MTTWYVHPVSGSDAADGLSWATAWDTIYNKQGSVAGGDTILIAKSVETDQAGTVTATNDSRTVSTTNDLTGSLAAGDIIRFDSEDTVYGIASLTSNTITLYRPYTGTTGSGKILKELTRLAVEPNNWTWLNPGSPTLNRDNRLTMKFGVNTATDLQDGFTVINSPIYSALSYGYRGYVDNSRLALWGNYSGITACWGCTFDKCLFTSPHFDSNNLTDQRRSVYTDCWNECHQSAGFHHNQFIGGYYLMKSYLGVIINGSKFIGTHIKAISDLFDYTFYPQDVEFINCRIEASYFFDSWRNIGHKRIIFRNCNLVGFVSVTSHSTDGLNGDIRFEHYNQIENDNRVWYFIGEPKVSYYQYNDSSVYRTSPYSIRFESNSSLPVQFIPDEIYIPARKGGIYTVTAWLRKNSAWGNDVVGVSSLPKMRLRRATGTVGSGMVRHRDEVTMTDVDDTWTQVSIGPVTHGFDTAMVLEFEFFSNNSGAILWIDDIEVMES